MLKIFRICMPNRHCQGLDLPRQGRVEGLEVALQAERERGDLIASEFKIKATRRGGTTFTLSVALIYVRCCDKVSVFSTLSCLTSRAQWWNLPSLLRRSEYHSTRRPFNSLAGSGARQIGGAGGSHEEVLLRSATLFGKLRFLRRLAAVHHECREGSSPWLYTARLVDGMQWPQPQCPPSIVRWLGKAVHFTMTIESLGRHTGLL